MPEAFGRYELRDLLGRGGMGEVYRAYDTDRDRLVALKLLPPHLAVDETYTSRFRRESRMAARLNEPHIVPIHDFGEIDGRLYIDMRLVDGRDLGRLLADGPLPIEIAVDIVGQVAAALDAAHESGLVHRDVKPSNILITGSDPTSPFVYLVDFGIARSEAEPGTAVTATTGTVGTVAYMSPERIAGEHGDPRADVYALACVLFEMLTGHKPYEGELLAIMYSHVHAPVPSARSGRPGVPLALDAVVRTGMAKDPAQRFPRAGDLARAARAALRGGAAGGSPGPGGGTRIGTAFAPPDRRPPPSGPVPAADPSRSGPVLPAPPRPGPAPHPSAPLPGHPPASTQIAPAARANTPPPRYPPPVYPSGYGGTGGQPPPSGPVWTPSSAHSGPVPPAGGSSRTRAIIAIVAALVVVGAAIGIALAVRGGGGSPDAQPSGVSSGPPSSTPPSSTPATAPSLPTGPGGTAVTWANFAAFTKLVGTRNGDTAHSFKGASCNVEARQGNSDIPGILDQVECMSGGVSIYVARFSSAATVSAYLDTVTAKKYTVTPVSMGGSGAAAALTYTSPDGANVNDITTRICALPNYLIQFATDKTSGVPIDSLHDSYWGSAVFPDVVPPPCNSGFTGPQAGAKPTNGISAAKPTATLSDDSAGSLLLALDPVATQNRSITVTSGVQAADVNQSGGVSFWQWSAATHSASRTGTSTYPYAPSSIGKPGAQVASAAVLTGMSDATFVVSGTFSTDGRGNAVAYTRSADTGWGAIKAEKDGSLAPSGVGVKPKGIGLSQGFALTGGRLRTADCPRTGACSNANAILKYWTWNAGRQEFLKTG